MDRGAWRVMVHGSQWVKHDREINTHTHSWFQCCVNFCCTSKWINDIYIHTCTYLHSSLDSIPTYAISDYWVDFPMLLYPQNTLPSHLQEGRFGICSPISSFGCLVNKSFLCYNPFCLSIWLAACQANEPGSVNNISPQSRQCIYSSLSKVPSFPFMNSPCCLVLPTPSCSHIHKWELVWKEGWVLKNWCFWTVLLEKTRESLGLQGDPTSPS